MSDTYVYDCVEVKLTGRTASKFGKKTRGGEVTTLTVVEITPVDKIVGSWKKFVPEELLFKIDPENEIV